jgi:hypothetical protein
LAAALGAAVYAHVEHRTVDQVKTDDADRNIIDLADENYLVRISKCGV